MPLRKYGRDVAEWSFLTNHAKALLHIAHQPDCRLRDIADAIGVTERTAYGIVVDLTEGGYLLKEKRGRRNRYQVCEELPLPDELEARPTIRQVLDLWVDRRQRGRPGPTSG